MKEETRFMLAFVLALLVIILFSLSPQRKNAQPVQKPIDTSVVEKPIGHGEFEISDNLVEMKNDLYNCVFDLLGGKIVSFSLNQYKRPDEKNFFFFQQGVTLLDSVENETGQLIYNISPDSKGNILVLESKRNELKIKKQIEIFQSKYSMNSTIVIQNNQNKSIIFPELNIYLGSINLSRKHPEDASIEFMVMNGGKPYKFNVARQTKEKIPGNVCVVRTRYQMYYFKIDKPVEFYVENVASKVTWGFKLTSSEIPAGGIKQYPFLLYIGPSDYFIARNEIKDPRVFGTGFFASMGRLIFLVLNKIHKFIPNWGFSIIILTVLIKIVFFPLTKSSLRSMKQMQKLRPYLQDIQKKYKDNPQMMQKEMMNLYKEFKINPFSGCLPMLIQIPIFVGFFLALRSSIFLRGSGFMLWIKDLSLPDTVATIGNIPINILPFLMFITSFFQQRMNPAVEQSQKFMNVIFPVMMLILFYNFSSGLLLYWVTMILAGLIEQYYIYKIAKK